MLQQALGARGSIAATTRSIRFVSRMEGSPRASAVLAQLVSGLYFSTLAVQMQRGRPLTDADVQRDQRANVAVISDRYWKRALGGSEDALGRTMVVNGQPVTIVGITPPGFVGVWTDSTADIWVPLALQQPLGYATNSSTYVPLDRNTPWIEEDGVAWLNLVARIERAQQPQARAVLQTTNARGVRQLTERFTDPRERPSMLSHTLAVEPFSRGFSDLRARFSDALYALAAMVAIVLLVTCANIANLLLARGTGRSRETGIRLALGATRGRLVRQYVTESLLLSFAGGIASIVAAHWTSGWLARAVITRSGDLPPVFAPDSRVWIFTAGLSIASALAFGLVPALRTIQAGLIHGIIANQRVTAHAALKSMRPLVAVQLALSFAMVFGAVLLGRTLAYFGRIDPGFEPDHLVSAEIDPDSSGYNRDQTMALVERLLTAVQSLPGVRSASLSTCGLVANCSYRSGFQIEDAGGGHNINNNWIAPGYFATVGIPVVAGRDFTDRDRAQSARVAIISESIARRYFPDQNPIGKRLGYQKVVDTEIVGVVRDARSITLRDAPIPMVYFPISQPPSFRPFPHSLDVRVSGDAPLAVAPIREAIARAEPGLLVDGVSPMSARLDRNVSRERLIAYLASAFGLLALALACVGLYGVLSYTVARRTQEIGVRMALGARPGDLIRMVIGDGTRVVVVGTIVGAFAAIGVGRLIKTLLVGVSASDPITYVAVGVVLVGTSLAASYIPARRAARVNPIAALRAD